MKNSLIKILILHSLDENIKLIKEAVISEHRNSLFIVAKSKCSFIEKIKWIQPDLVVSDIRIEDISGEKASRFVKKEYVNVPFVFAIESEEQTELLLLKVKENKLGLLNLSSISEQSEILKKIILKRIHQRETDATHQDTFYRNKVILNKAMTLYEEGNGLDKKEEVAQLLKEIQSEFLK